MAAADVIAVPSVHDDAGNVDGLPNFALEAMASATPVVSTTAGGLAQVIERRRHRRASSRSGTRRALAAGDFRTCWRNPTRAAGWAPRHARASSAISAGRGWPSGLKRPYASAYAFEVTTR